MTMPFSRLAACWTAVAIALLASIAWADFNGFVSARGLDLWARAILALDGSAGAPGSGPIDAPIPLLLTYAGHALTRGTDAPVPSLLAAGLGAALVLSWFDYLNRKSGYDAPSALLVTVLLAMNPFFLRAISDGPQTVLLTIGVWVFARGLVDLRQSANAPDMMKVSAGLLLAALSGNYGIVIGIAAIPFIVVAARPGVLVASPWGYLVAMYFPIVAVIGSLLFVAAISDRALSWPVASVPTEAQGAIPQLLTLAGLTPVALLAVGRTIRSAHHVLPLLAAAGTVLGAYAFNLICPVEPDAAIAAAPMLPVVAVALGCWPQVRLRRPAVASLTALGLALSAVSITATPGTETGRWVAAVLPRSPAPAFPDRQVAAFVKGKTDIMVDAERNPELVVALGTTRDLLVAGRPGYDLAMQGGRIRANFIVVRRDGRGDGAPDAVRLRFPRLDTDTLPRFEQVYENSGWRVFGRTG